MSADPRNMLRYRGDAIDRSHDRVPPPYEITPRTIAYYSGELNMGVRMFDKDGNELDARHVLQNGHLGLRATLVYADEPETYRIFSDEREKE